jgi:Ni/Fe-hydrogenase subunit HybB-like protein
MRDAASAIHTRLSIADRLLLGLTPREYVKSVVTSPFDIIAAAIIGIGIPLIVYRFVYGLGAVTNLTQSSPWGLWIGFDMLAGVALAAGGFTLASTVYIFGLEDYHPVVRPAVLTGFLGYIFAVLGLICDLGRPWNLPLPLVYSFGTTSVMFEVAWCISLYSVVLFLEFVPSVLEWLGYPGLRARLVKLTIGLTVAAVMLSTLHQSSLGGLFLMAPHRLHPLWYSPFIPVFFFISAIAGGLSMVIVESALSHRAFESRVDHHVDVDRLAVGLGRAASVVLFAYFFLRLQGLADANRWDLLFTSYGYWFLFEVIGFVLVPCLLFAHGARTVNVRLVRWTAAWTVLGIVVYRLNVSVIAFNWNLATRYIPSAAEIWTSLTLVTLGVVVFRWIVNRMPVLRDLPEYHGAH